MRDWQQTNQISRHSDWVDSYVRNCYNYTLFNSYRPAYQSGISPDTTIGYPSLLSAIKELHAIVR